MIRHLRLATVVASILGLALQATDACAAWPERPLTLVVPFPAGGSTDITARQLAAGLRAELGQSVVVDNRAGAGGNVGGGVVANAPADGYTLLMATNAHAASEALYKKLNYSFRKGLVPVAHVVSFPNVLVVRPDFPAQSLESFITYIKKSNQPIYYGSAGNGSSHHLATALLSNMAGADLKHVPYKGGAPAVLALLSGELQMLVAPLVEVLPYVKSQKLTALGITAKDPAPLLPNVPPIGSVLPGYDVSLWSGIFAPAGTPNAIINTVNAAVRKVLKSPEMAQRLAEQGYKVFDEAPDALGPLYVGEIARWSRMVKISGAQVD